MLNGLATAWLVGAIGFAGGDRTIVTLRGQRASVTISSTANGVRYSAKDARGQAICSNLTLDQLHAQHPLLYRQVEPALCAEADARIDAPVAVAGE